MTRVEALTRLLAGFEPDRVEQGLAGAGDHDLLGTGTAGDLPRHVWAQGVAEHALEAGPERLLTVLVRQSPEHLAKILDVADLLDVSFPSELLVEAAVAATVPAEEREDVLGDLMRPGTDLGAASRRIVANRREGELLEVLRVWQPGDATLRAVSDALDSARPAPPRVVPPRKPKKNRTYLVVGAGVVFAAVLLVAAVGLVVATALTPRSTAEQGTSRPVRTGLVLRGRIRAAADAGPARGLDVALAGCASGLEARTDLLGEFLFEGVAPECREPPLQFWVRSMDRWSLVTVGQLPAEIDLPGDPPTLRAAPIGPADVVTSALAPFSPGPPVSTATAATVVTLGCEVEEDCPEHVGTGFLVAPDLIVTGRSALAPFTDAVGRARPALPLDVPLCARFSRSEECYSIAGVEVIHPHWDLAILRLDREAPVEPLAILTRPPIPLVGLSVSVGGLSGKVRGVASEAGSGTEILVHSVEEAEVAAPVVDVATGALLGVHFGAREGAEAFAIPAWLLWSDPYLRSLPIRFSTASGRVTSVVDSTAPGFHPVAYDPAFLGRPIDLPGLPAGHAAAEGGEVPYVHFSAVMNQSRRIPWFTAHNIDRSSLSDIEVARRDLWAVDPRVPRTAQLATEDFSGHGVARGFLVPVADVVWGDPGEAAGARRAAFSWTNAAPRSPGFDGGPWGQLEQWVRRDLEPEATRLTVFTGPVLGEQDAVVSGIRLPTAWWKLVAVPDGADALKVFAFVVSREAATGRRADPLAWQVSVADLADVTGLSFGDLGSWDTASAEPQ